MRGGVGPRRSVRLVAVAAAALVAGALPGTNSAATGSQGELSLGYTCRFVSGAQDVTIAFSQTFPSTGAVGQPIRPGVLKMTVALPRAGVTALLPADTGSVTAAGDLTTRVAQGSSTAEADWPGLAAGDTPVAGADALLLTFVGQAPGVKVTAPGDVVFSPQQLTLVLHPLAARPPASGTPTAPPPSPTATSPAGPAGTSGAQAATRAAAKTGTSTGTKTAGGAVTSTGASTATTTSPTEPAGGLTGDCTPKAGQDAVLATVHVPAEASGAPGSGSPSAPGPSASTGAGAAGDATGSGPSAAAPGRRTAGSTVVPLEAPVHSGLTTCGKTPHGDPDPKRLPPVSPQAIVLPFPGDPPYPDGPMCGFAVGFANQYKLNGAMIVNDPHAHPVMAEVNAGRRKVLDFTNDYVEVDSVLALNLPPSSATFLTYGFMPTSATVQFVPRGLMTIVQSGDSFFDQPILTTIGGYQDIRVRDVRINGTPLDVGPNCHTATPIDVELKGREDDYIPGGDGKPDYDIVNGGPLVDDDLVIPPFTGCAAHGENLDALFTSALSGPGNTLNLSQGRLCDPINIPEQTCLPEIQIPPLPHRR
ncbi:DUF6801 domain-containing protein [Streptomyces sp. V4-01]|uniref:DUF6801 domain-containing protein n=1 Tax=Actinacidiphila polyblastidii TaxID=3110430 RepID=A0ABU7PEH1_9ACTN|nr:DUF6801 domain-containing protein [Streptomyces sp. V4-01]